MTTLKPIHFLGDSPIELFDEAADIIAERRATCTSVQITKARQSVAVGLSKKFDRSLTTENLFFTPNHTKALECSAKLLEIMCHTIQKVVTNAGMPVPECVLMARGFTDETFLDPFEGHNFKLARLNAYNIGDDNLSSIDLRHFINRMKELMGKSQFHFERQSHEGEETTYRFILGYIDASPDYPNGHIRSKRQTEFLSGYLEDIKTENKNYLKRFLREEEATELSDAFLVIENYAWYGFEYEPCKPYSFSQLSDKWAENTHMIFDIGRCGLGRIDGGILVAPGEHILAIKNSRDSGKREPPISIVAAEYMFGSDISDQAQRERFLKKYTDLCAENSVIAHAVINGGAREFLTPMEYNVAKRWLVEFGGLAESETELLLEKGIHGINAVNLPDAGRVMFVDFHGLMHWDPDKAPVDEMVDEEYNLLSAGRAVRRIAQNELNLTLGGEGRLGCDESCAFFIMPISVTPPDLIEGLLRLRQLSELVLATPPFLKLDVPEPYEPLILPERQQFSELLTFNTRIIESPAQSLTGFIKAEPT